MLKLNKPHLNHGQTLWIDNYFNAPDPVHFQKTKGTNYVGTLHVNKKSPMSEQNIPGRN